MTKAAAFLFIGLALVANSPTFARDHQKRQPSAPTYSGWQAPYDLPAGPNDIPFAPF
jgi:hypothetical protein